MLHEIKVKPFHDGKTIICKTSAKFAKELNKLVGVGRKVVMSVTKYEGGALFVFEAVDDSTLNAVAFEAPCPPFCTPTIPTNVYIETP